MSLFDKIWNIAQEKENHAGFTVDLNRMRRAGDEGYCVAFAETQKEDNKEKIDPKDALAKAMKHAQGPDGKGIIGGWYNNDNKSYYFDSIKIYTTRVAAIEAAKVNQQIGIYHLGRREYVPIMENQSFNPSLAALRQRAHSF